MSQNIALGSKSPANFTRRNGKKQIVRYRIDQSVVVKQSKSLENRQAITTLVDSTLREAHQSVAKDTFTQALSLFQGQNFRLEISTTARIIRPTHRPLAKRSVGQSVVAKQSKTQQNRKAEPTLMPSALAEALPSDPKATLENALLLLEKQMSQLTNPQAPDSRVSKINQFECMFKYKESFIKFGEVIFTGILKRYLWAASICGSAPYLIGTLLSANLAVGVTCAIIVAAATAISAGLAFSLMTNIPEIQQAWKNFGDDLDKKGLCEIARQANAFMQDCKQTRQNISVINRALNSFKKTNNQDTKKLFFWGGWHEQNIQIGIELSKRINANPFNTETCSPSNHRPASAYNPFYWMFLKEMIFRA